MLSIVGTPSPARMQQAVTLSQAVDALIAAKTLANYRPAYIKSLRSYLRQFSQGRENVPISSLDIFTIENWFAARSEAPATRASNIGRLSALFSFATRRGWTAANPCALLERPRLDRKTPSILSPTQSHHLLFTVRAQRPHMLPFFTLALLAGIRPDELARLSWSSVDVPNAIVIIDAATSKVRRRRIVPLPPESLPLLALSGRLPVSRSTRRRYLMFACVTLGLQAWPHDILRHTAASFLLARHADAGRVALMLGHSTSTLLTHYHGLVTPQACSTFWSALKPTLKP